MAETHAHIPQTLAEQYALEKQEKPVVVTKPVETEVDNVPTKEVVSEKAEEAPPAVEETPVVALAVEESPVVTPASEESSEATPPVAVEESSEPNPATEDSSEAAPEESSDSADNSGDQEAAAETPEIKIETAPADFRFPTTNQTRHCFTRYVEYHRCIAAKGEEAPECDKFKKYYRSLCPGEWVERWNEQRENGTFPGPL